MLPLPTVHCCVLLAVGCAATSTLSTGCLCAHTHHVSPLLVQQLLLLLLLTKSLCVLLNLLQQVLVRGQVCITEVKLNLHSPQAATTPLPLCAGKRQR